VMAMCTGELVRGCMPNLYFYSMQHHLNASQPPLRNHKNRWHIGSRRCVESFHNEDGTITSSLALSSKFLAVGAESGVVNLYNEYSSSLQLNGRKGGLSLTKTERTPHKSIMNLTTSADNLCFNSTGDILAMSTKREKNGLKLLHIPSATVFSNWPTSKTPLKYVWSMDFSPGSKYLAVGNDHGKVLLYRVKHYWD
jgi:U3 small nucleolar RNA-associated protein 18